MQIGTDAIPEQCTAVHAHAAGHLAGEVGHSLAVAGGSVVARLHSLRPAPHDVEKSFLQSAYPPHNRDVDSARAQLNEGAIGPIESEQRAHVAVEAGKEVGFFSGHLGHEQEVVRSLRLAVGLVE